MIDHVRQATPKSPSDSDFVYRSAIKAKALDAIRGILPAAAQSNVGIYATGQSYEQMLLRMRADPLPEARFYADLILEELRKVIPSFVKRVDLADRGQVASTYLENNRASMAAITDELLGAPDVYDDDERVELIDFDPDAEVKLVASMLYPHTHLSEADIESKVQAMSTEDRLRVINDLQRRSNQSSPSSRSSARAPVLSIRRARRLRCLPGPPAPSNAHGRVAETESPAWLHQAVPGRRGRCSRPIR